MKDSPLLLLLSNLSNGQIETLNEIITPSVLPSHIKALSPLTLTGTAYLTDSDLIIHYSLSLKLTVPCPICGRFTPFALSLNDLYITKPLINIPNYRYNYFPHIEEEILLNAPSSKECEKGGCPQRRDLSPYLKETDKKSRYFPFSSLE